MTFSLILHDSISVWPETPRPISATAIRQPSVSLMFKFVASSRVHEHHSTDRKGTLQNITLLIHATLFLFYDSMSGNVFSNPLDKPVESMTKSVWGFATPGSKNCSRTPPLGGVERPRLWRTQGSSLQRVSLAKPCVDMFQKLV